MAAEGGRQKLSEIGVKNAVLGILGIAGAFGLSLGPFQDPLVDAVSGTVGPVLAWMSARRMQRRRANGDPAPSDDEQTPPANESGDERVARLERELRELRAGQQQLQTGQQELQTGQQRLETGQQELQTGQHQLQAGQRQLQGGQQQLQAGHHQLQAGQQQLRAGVQQVHGGLQQVGAGQAQTRSDVDELRTRTGVLETTSAGQQQEMNGLRTDVEQQGQAAAVRDQIAANQDQVLEILVNNSAGSQSPTEPAANEDERLRQMQSLLSQALRQNEALRTENETLRAQNGAPQQAGAGPLPPPPGPDPTVGRGAGRGAPSFTPASRTPQIVETEDQETLNELGQRIDDLNVRNGALEGRAAGRPPVNPADGVDQTPNNPYPNQNPPGGPTGPRH